VSGNSLISAIAVVAKIKKPQRKAQGFHRYLVKTEHSITFACKSQPDVYGAVYAIISKRCPEIGRPGDRTMVVRGRWPINLIP